MAINALILTLLLSIAGAEAVEDDNIFFKSSLPPAKESYKILFLAPTKLKSHALAQVPLVSALANRGHKVVFLSESSWTHRHPKVTYVDHSALVPSSADQPAVIDNLMHVLLFLRKSIALYTENLFDDPVFQDLYKIRKEFDIIIIDDLLFMALYPFVHGTTYAIISTSTLHPYPGAIFGNHLNPSFVSSSLEEFPQPYSTWHRFKNWFHTLTVYFICRYLISNSAESEVASRFPSVPPSHVVHSNASLYMTMMDFALDGPFPILPLMVPVAGLTVKPVKPLPKDLSEFLSGDTPAIYVSFGSSFGHSKQFQVYNDIFFSVFSRLPYKVIFRFNEHLKKNYKNLFIRDWLPQQDILGHPNVKACLNHGGVMSVHEITSHGVPILGFPFVPEHRRMLQGLVHGGQGLIIEWSELSEQKLTESIMEIMENPSYRNKMAEKSRIFNDQRESPLDRGVYWTEYVAKYKGAPHLQSPAKHLSWIVILNLDVLVLFLLTVYALFRLQMRLLRKLATRISKKWRGVRKKQKNN